MKSRQQSINHLTCYSQLHVATKSCIIHLKVNTKCYTENADIRRQHSDIIMLSIRSCFTKHYSSVHKHASLSWTAGSLRTSTKARYSMQLVLSNLQPHFNSLVCNSILRVTSLCKMPFVSLPIVSLTLILKASLNFCFYLSYVTCE